MRQKHYKAFSKIIRETRKAMDEDGRCQWFHAVNTIECKLAQYFQDNDVQFDRQEFIADCVRLKP